MQVLQKMWVQSWGWKIPWRRKWQPTSVFLPGKSPCTEEPGGLQSMGSQTWLSTHTRSKFSADVFHVGCAMPLWCGNLHGAWVPLVWKGALEMWERGGSSEPSERKGFPIFYCKPCILSPQVITTSPPYKPVQALWFLKDSMWLSGVTPLSDLTASGCTRVTELLSLSSRASYSGRTSSWTPWPKHTWGPTGVMVTTVTSPLRDQNPENPGDCGHRSESCCPERPPIVPVPQTPEISGGSVSQGPIRTTGSAPGILNKRIFNRGDWVPQWAEWWCPVMPAP